MEEENIKKVISNINFINKVIQNIKKEHEYSLEQLKKGTTNINCTKKLEDLISNEEKLIKDINTILNLSIFK